MTGLRSDKISPNRLFLLLSLIFSLASAQENITFYNIGVAEGLTDLTVNSIAQDSIGLIYFGTDNGLCIYDGKTYENYFSQISQNSISSNIINTIRVDRKNQVWIGNSKSIDVYNRKNHTFKKYKIRQQDYGIQSIFEDKTGIIWIGTFGAGLHHFDEKNDTILEANYSPLYNSSIAAISEDIWGNLWIGTEYQGLFLAEANSRQIFSFSEGVPGISQACNFETVRIRSLCPDNKGNMLIGTYDNGLFYYNSSLKTIDRLHIKINELHNKSKISSIVTDINNDFWISTDGEGLYQYKTIEQIIVRINNTDPAKDLSSQSLRTLFIDKDNTLWTGTFKAGVSYTYYLNQSSFRHFIKGFDNSNITSLLEIEKDKIAVGTDGGGLYLFDIRNNQVKNLNSNFGPDAKNILCLHKDSHSNYWIGTYDQGLFKTNKSFFLLEHITKTEKGLNHNDIRSIASDSANLYIGTNGGGLNTYCFGDKSFKYNYIDYNTHDTGLAYNFVGPTLVDSRGNIWAGTFNGVSFIEKKSKKLINLSAAQHININSLFINSIFEDSHGKIWFGTNNGLSRLDKSVWELEDVSSTKEKINTYFNFSNFLVNEKNPLVVNSILEDSYGNLWLGTNQGLHRFSVSNNKSKRFFTETGINVQLFNARAACRSEGGYLYFGGSNGFIGFSPDSVSEKDIETSPVIRKFYINLKEINCNEVVYNDTLLTEHINYLKKIKLSHKARIFSIAYGSTNTFLPGEIEYAYMLSGFDENWNFPDKNNYMATYSNLNPGKYTFKLKARYNNADWNDNIRELEIEILPPFYKTWYFRSALILFILLSLYLIYLQRVSNLKNRNLKLEKIIEVRTQQLMEEKEAKLLEFERNKTLQLEKELADKERLRIEKDMQEAQNEKLSAELNLINEKENVIKAELSASLAQISKTNDLLQGLKNELNTIIESNEEEKSTKIKQIIQRIDSETYFKDDWHKFETHFNVVYNDFIKRIKTDFPELTRKDLRLCSYMRMNLSGNEIAQLSNITVRGVEKSRSRLRKKLNLTPEADLNDFIINY